jgi:hypothetical protein
MSRKLLLVALAIGAFILLCVVAYYLPPVHDRLSWRLNNFRVEIIRYFNPPEEVVFVPQEQVDAIVAATLTARAPAATPTPTWTPSPLPTIPGLTETPLPTSTPSPTPMPIPESVTLTGIRHEYQNFNNCGPANLSMALSYWGWDGNQNVTRAYLRPNYAVDDKNVNPFEMVDFVEQFTPYRALWRVGGDLELVKRLVAGGFPLILELGLQPEGEAWLGHYRTVAGYDEARQQMIIYDSYIGVDRGYPVPYAEIEQYWRHFNHVYVVIYEPEQESEIFAILGPHADPDYSFRQATERARAEINMLSGQDAFFAWFNLGGSLVWLEDYAAAAEAFDAAFALYAGLPLSERPWRMLWYVDGPYTAYYHTGRYQDVINLAQATLVNVDKPVLEETYYWRGMAKAALGDRAGALEDLRLAYQSNPNSTPAGEALRQLGENP